MTTRACTHAFCRPYGLGCLFDSAVHTDAHGNLIDTCGHCQFLPTTGEPVRAVQVGCPVHSAHPEARRVRTQVERDADGTAWRAAADSRPVTMLRCVDFDTSPEPDAVPLRRRWWHRYTRRAR